MQHQIILNEQQIQLKLQRLATEVVEHLPNDVEVVILGIQTRGYTIAQQIAHILKNEYQLAVSLHSVLLNKDQPEEVTIDPIIDCTNKHILLVDDVANSGRTLLYALKPLLNYHAASIKTLVLVERMYKQFPIKPDFVGVSIASTIEDHILVNEENGVITNAYLK